MQNRFNEFKVLLDTSYRYLEQRNFDSALALYHYIDAKYNKLPEEDKTQYIKNSLDHLKKELILYLNITDLSTNFEKKSEDELKEKLDYVQFLINDIISNYPKSKPLIQYAVDNHKSMSDMLKKHIYERGFKHLYEEIQILKNTNPEEAFRKYNYLIDCYRELTKSGYDYKLLEELRKLLSELRLRQLEGKAYLKIKNKPTDFQFDKVESPVEYRNIKPTETQDFDKRFTELHELLKKNELKKAEKLYQNL